MKNPTFTLVLKVNNLFKINEVPCLPGSSAGNSQRPAPPLLSASQLCGEQPWYQR